MAPTGRRRGSGRRGAAASTTSNRQGNGLFTGTQWLCNCEPRLPMLHLQTKKQGPNKGRWFYKCPARNKCGYFLWEDEAKLREPNSDAAPPPSSTASAAGGPPPPPATQPRTPQPTTRQTTLWDANGFGTTTPVSTFKGKIFGSGLGRPESSSSSTDDPDDTDAVEVVRCPAPEPPSTPTPKRKRGLDDEYSDGEYSDDLDSDMERRMVALSEASERQRPAAAPSTPPTGAGGLPTPVSRNTLLIASEQRSSKRVRFTPDVDPPTSPTPSSRTLTLLTPPTVNPSTASTPSADPSSTDYEITTEVLALLAPHAAALDPAVLPAVRKTLNSFALRAVGVLRSRDMVRAALATRDTRITELKARVDELENGRRVEKARAREIRMGLLALVGSGDGDGLGIDGEEG